MQRVSQIIDLNSEKLKQPLTTSTTGAGQQTIDKDESITLVNMVFARLKAMYNKKYSSAFGSGEALKYAKREWLDSLASQKLTSERVGRALDMLKHDKSNENAWPPSLPQFIEYCKASTGLASVDAAYIEACRGCGEPDKFKWSHVTIRLAAKETGSLELRSEPERMIKPRFKNNYETMCNRFLSGEDLGAAIPKALPSPDEIAKRPPSGESKKNFSDFVNGF